LTVPIAETPPRTLARIAGLLYLIIIVCGIFSEAFIRASLVVPNDASATIANIKDSLPLFRVGFVADSVMLLSDVAIAVLFYILLAPVSKTLALMAAAFRLTQAAVLGFNLLNYYTPVLLLTGAGYATVFQGDQQSALVMLYLDMHSHGYDLGLLFFGLSNVFLGYLVAKSGYFPTILGYGLVAAAVIYLVGSFTRFALPDHTAFVTPLYVVPLIAELSFCLWLLVKGVRN
jgi:hypothetical protein